MKIMTIKLKEPSFVIFIMISMFYFIGNIIWWFLYTPIVPINISAAHFNDIFSNSYLYFNAPLITWVMKVIFFIFGKHYFDLWIILVNYIFFLVALYCMYKIGLELKDKETGNVAMILFALTPIVYEMSRQYGHQDWHVMIAMIVNIYCLIKLNYFKNRKWSILYGISVGLGLLIKDAFLAYFFTPWVYVLVRSLVERIEGNKIINIFITITFGSLISLCHYFRFEIIYKILNEPIIETKSVFSFENIREMTIGLSENLLSPPLFLLLLIGFVYFLIIKNRNKWIISLWFIVPWSIMTFMPHHKQPEYCLGLVPAIVLIVSVFITSIKNVNKKLLIFPIILILFIQYIFFYFNKNLVFGEKIYWCNRVSNSSCFKNAKELSFYLELLSCINKSYAKGCVILDAQYLNPHTIEFVNNMYMKKNLIFRDYRYPEQFNVFVTDEKGIINKDTYETILGEYKMFVYNPLETEKTKQEYIEKRMRKLDILKSFIETNFVEEKSFLYKGSLIRVLVDKRDDF